MRLDAATVRLSDPLDMLKLMAWFSLPPTLETLIDLVPVDPAYVQFTTGVPEITKLVPVEVNQIPPALPVITTLPVPKSIVRELLLFDKNELHVKVLDPRDNTPAVKVNKPDIVWLAPSVNPSVELFRVAMAQTDPLAVVQVPVPELLSKITVSAATGAEAPPAPPDVADQLVVLLASHVPVPPTQYLVAITAS